MHFDRSHFFEQLFVALAQLLVLLCQLGHLLHIAFGGAVLGQPVDQRYQLPDLLLQLQYLCFGLVSAHSRRLALPCAHEPAAW